jgi:hypothetical protein
MIITRLQGGLGNQLFQWATGRYLSMKNNCELKFDLSFYPMQTLRKVEIDQFLGVNLSAVNQFDIVKPVIEVVDDFTFKEIEYDPSKILYLNGYWQNEKYFDSIRETIKKDLVLDESEMSKLKLTPLIDMNITSIHIRRTDYVSSNGFHPVQSINYYQKAIDIIGDYDYLFVFSDDIDWCRENFSFKNMVFMTHPRSNIHDMLMMSMCKNNIIANSSFSWWAAWLNDNPNKKVVAPKNWLGENSGIDYSSIVPNSWIKI